MNVETPGHECQGSGRRPVQPLHIVDSEQHRSVFRQFDDQRPHSHANRLGVRQATSAKAATCECKLQRLPLRARERADPLVHNRPQQVAQADERQPGLGLITAAPEHAVPHGRGRSEYRKPEGRLSDPRLALDQQRLRALGHALEELPRLGELRITADDHVTILAPRHPACWESAGDTLGTSQPEVGEQAAPALTPAPPTRG